MDWLDSVELKLAYTVRMHRRYSSVIAEQHATRVKLCVCNIMG